MEYLDLLGKVIDDGKAKGLFRKEISTGILKHTVFGALDQAVLVWIYHPQRHSQDLDQVGDQLIDFVWRAAGA